MGMRQLDLGAGGSMRLWPGVKEEDYYPVDIEPTSDKVKKVDLILGGIPFEDDTFDVVTAYDFMEHIPQMIYLPLPYENIKSEKETKAVLLPNGNLHGRPPVERRNCLIELFNESYRVLKGGGVFHMQSPAFPGNASVSDPGHVSYWTEDSANYYSGDYFGFHDHYGHTSRFEKVTSVKDERDRIVMQLKAIKGLPKDAEYKLNY